MPFGSIVHLPHRPPRALATPTAVHQILVVVGASPGRTGQLAAPPPTRCSISLTKIQTKIPSTNSPAYCNDTEPKMRAVDRSGHSTVFMVVMLVTVVGGVFIVFALMALCYRSVVVHRNLSLCLRLVSQKIFSPYQNLMSVLFDRRLPSVSGRLGFRLFISLVSSSA
jgi:hypothetical protein